MAVASVLPSPIDAFLTAGTPEAWIHAGLEQLPVLLNDHANCELKAASTALSFIYRYPERTQLCDRMSRLAREELRHFEQVRKIMDEMGIPFERLTASRYAARLHESVRPREPERLLDSLLIGALIEARSCERFAALAPRLPQRLGEFYSGLLASEARHFENYLALAKTETRCAERVIRERLHDLLETEAGLITRPDPQFRFHSGTPEAPRPAGD